MLDRTTYSTTRAFKVLAWPAPAPQQMNPYISLIYSEFQQAGMDVQPFRVMRFQRQAANVFHVHWPEAILWGRLAHIFPFVTKVAAEHALQVMDDVHDNGGSVVWTVHNLVPHAVPPSQQSVWNSFFSAFRRRVDLVIGMTERSLDLACNAYPELASRARIVIPHPHFRTAYPTPPEMAAAREKIQIPEDAFVIGMLGSIRQSKGIPQAIAAFRDAHIVNTIVGMMEMMLVSGDCGNKAEQDRIEQAIGIDTGIAFRTAPLSPADLVDSFAAVDAVLINQQTTLNSGTLLLALSMNRPVIAPAGGSIGELANEFGKKWIFTFSGELTAPKLRDLIDQVKRANRPLLTPLQKFDPALVSRATAAALYQTCARHGGQGPQHRFSGLHLEKPAALSSESVDHRYH